MWQKSLNTPKKYGFLNFHKKFSSLMYAFLALNDIP